MMEVFDKFSEKLPSSRSHLIIFFRTWTSFVKNVVLNIIVFTSTANQYQLPTLIKTPNSRQI